MPPRIYRRKSLREWKAVVKRNKRQVSKIKKDIRRLKKMLNRRRRRISSFAVEAYHDRIGVLCQLLVMYEKVVKQARIKIKKIKRRGG